MAFRAKIRGMSAGVAQLRRGAVALALGLVAVAPVGVLGVSHAAADTMAVDTMAGDQGAPGTVSLARVACPSPSACVAVGIGSSGQGVVVTITEGAADVTQVVSGTTQLNDVACPSPTICEAVGANSSGQGVLVPIAAGVPSGAQVIPGSGPLEGVACFSATICEAVGSNAAVAVTSGIPGTVQMVPDTFLNSVACPSVTTCVAVGTVGAIFGAGPLGMLSQTEGVVITITNGIPSADSSAFNPGGYPGIGQGDIPGQELLGVACADATTCEAVGYQFPRPAPSSDAEGVVVHITNGIVDGTQFTSMPSTLFGVACSGGGTCAAVGYGSSTQTIASGVLQGVFVPITNGTVGTTQFVSGFDRRLALDGVACPSVTTCEAVGFTAPNGVPVQGAVVTIITGNYPGTLTVAPGPSVALSDATVNGDVVVEPGGSLAVDNSTIGGSLTASSPAAVQVCGSTVGGSVGVTGATGPVVIGFPFPCAANTIGGSLLLENNTGGVLAVGNRVGVAVVSAGNSGGIPFFNGSPDVQATPTLTTATVSSVTVGTPLTDTATVAGGLNPTGAIGFAVFPTSNCLGAGTPVPQPVTVEGNGTYTSATYTPDAAGSFSWGAFYTGDANNTSVISACEPFTVTASPTLPTRPTLTTAAPASVVVGSAISDTATLSGGLNPTGAIGFAVFPTSNCLGVGTPVPQPVTVVGNGTYTSATYTPDAAGSFSWGAFYTGDANNTSVISACEPFTVTTSPTLTTSAPASVVVGTAISDTATLAGGLNPTGAIGFAVFPTSNCLGTGTPVPQPVTVVGNGTYTSATYIPDAAGSFSWGAFYTGDGNNTSVISACEPFTVTTGPAVPT